MKTRITYSLTIFATLFLFLTTGAYGQSDNVKTSRQQIESKIDSILSLMTLEEKVGLCHAQSKFSTKGVERLGIPELWMSDGPHGVRAEISWDSWGYAGWTNDSITAFPALTCLAATFNPELAGEYGFSIGEEARYRKKDVLLGPGVNIYRTPFNGRNFEYMGEDPCLASKMVVPYIQGVQKNGVAACVKHYALNNQELWRNHINVEVSDRALHEIYLPAFKAAVTKGNAWAIMGSYNKLRGQFCSHNELLINKILKGDWNFDGVVITDWGSAHSTLEAAKFGLDIEMGTGTDGFASSKENHYNYYYLANPFLKMLKNGEINEEIVNDKVQRILRLRYRTNMNASRPLGCKNTKEHHNVARKIADEGIVLLKNENNFFPIKDDKNLVIAVIGENATQSMTIGGGSSELKAQFEISPLEGLKNRFKNATIKYTLGYATGPGAWDRVVPSPYNADSLRAEAVKIAKDADIVLLVGGLNKDRFQDTEGADRTQYGLPFGQVELINKIYDVNKNIGFILLSGNAVEMPWIDKIQAVAEVWYLGSMAGTAIADVVSGDVNPSGKLPFSFPVKPEDNAAISFGKLSYPGDNINVHFKEGILVGYRWFDTKNIKPLFAFGYGLSYTTFDLSNIKANNKNYSDSDKINITCNVTNTGDTDGAEVVQVYIGKQNSKVPRAEKELKGFKKTELKKGETKLVSIDIDVAKLAYYDEAISDWNIEKGDYTIYIGTASNNIKKKINITVK